jgi:uncharacterized membrane protein YkvA (DUF1232 family)
MRTAIGRVARNMSPYAQVVPGQALSQGRKHIGWVHAFFRFFLSPTAGIGSKLLVLASLIYLFLPVDLVPDVIPVVGWLDDMGFVAVALGYLARTIGKYRKDLEAKTEPPKALPPAPSAR